MTALKCKMCGADLVTAPDSAVCKCEYCGSTQTVPKVSDEKELALFELAGRLRVHGEFEKASGVYESILALYPEEAEAYWGLVLCKYGIEYTDAPDTGKKTPVCRRPVSGSVLEDRNYKLTCRYASPETKQLYCDEAKVIDKLPRAKPVKTSTHKTGLLIGVLSAAVVAVAAFVVVLFTLLMPNIRYQHAVTLMESGRYDEAVEAFEAMDGYKDSTTQIKECHYEAAVALMESGSYDEAITAFEAMNGYKDSVEQIENCKTGLKDLDYDAAVALMEKGSYDDAIAAFEAMDGYRDSEDKISEICSSNEYFASKHIGDTLYFGSYEQDGYTEDGNERITWRVLDENDNAILVVSEYILAAMLYEENWAYETRVTWENCTLRSWLNNDFYSGAFNSEEQDRILTTDIVTPDNPDWGTEGGSDTQDKVFLLSSDEAECYFENDDDRMCIPTEYAMANGANFDEEYSLKYGEIVNTCQWWLRSPGELAFQVVGGGYADEGEMMGVNRDGTLLESEYLFCESGVRPALWIALAS